MMGDVRFISSNFALYLHKRYPQAQIVILDTLTYVANRANLRDGLGHPNVEFVRGDMCALQLFEALMKTHTIDTLVHFAAESHVDPSILEPGAFVQTSIIGTFTLL